MPPDEPRIRRHHTCEILVIGAGVSGYCAAIQAGRMGCRTILIEKDAVLGGNAGPDVGVGITGADRYNPYGTETGIIHEIQEEAAWVRGFTQVSRGSMPYNISRRFEAVVQTKLEEAGVQILKRHYARRPILDSSRRITGVIVEDLASFQTVRIDIAHVVIEASGDGEIGVLAGADFDVGSEARSEFAERSAPEARTNTVQGTSLVAIAQRTDHEVIFIPPPGTPPFAPRVWHSRLSSFIHHHDGWLNDEQDIKFLYVTEAGGSMDTIREDGAIYELLLKQLWAEWHHIKNGPHSEAARNWDLLWVSPKAGKRESRRLLGDVIITQTDLESGRRFPDDIAYGGHDLDDHQPLGGTGNIFGHSIPPMYGIPYRACYSRNVPNLLLAGRLISATHLAHSSTRLMRTGGAVGQAVGIAAALCCSHRCSPRTIHTDHLEELQRQLMAADGTILNRDLSPADDLAPSASVTSSSELRYNDQRPGLMVPLIARAGAVLWDWPPTLEAIELYLENTTDGPQPLHITVYRASRDPKWTTVDAYDRHQRDDLRDSAFAQIARIPVTLPAV
ncbi:MAG: FAD-dependent oxidoreductase, partial [Anaerolineae bacterium]|nr:FAD-dependent oxidoreductase [Anaerolineae bacterium]